MIMFVQSSQIIFRVSNIVLVSFFRIKYVDIVHSQKQNPQQLLVGGLLLRLDLNQ